jgi:hypothetical protein
MSKRRGEEVAATTLIFHKPKHDVGVSHRFSANEVFLSLICHQQRQRSPTHT